MSDEAERAAPGAAAHAPPRAAPELRRNADALLRLIIESTPGAIAILDPQMRYLAVSRRWQEDYRLTDDQAIGRSHYEVFPEIPERWRAAHRRCLAGAVERCDEDPFPRADGTLDWIRWEIHPWYGPAGQVGGIVIFSEHVTERKLAEEALRRGHRALLMLTRCTEATLRAVSEEALFAEVCQVIVETGGYRMCWVGAPGEDARRTVRPVASAGEVGDYLAVADVVWSDTERGRGPTGTALRTGRLVVGLDFAVDAALAPWREAAARLGFRSLSALPLLWEGQRLGVLTMYSAEPRAFDEAELQFLSQLAEDLAFGVHALRERARRVAAEQERAQALERLAAEKERLAVTLRSIGDAVVVTDAAARVTLMNGMAERLTGWQAAHAAGRPICEVLELVDEGTGAPVENPVERILRDGDAPAPRQPAALVTRGGPPRPIACTAAAIRDAAGRLAGVVLVFRDQTDERRIEERVRQGQKLESIGRLAGGIAHDFNNLLTVILSCSDALRRDLAAGKALAREDVEEIHGAGERARDLTRQLLTFARKQVTVPAPLDLNAVVRDSEKLLRRVLGEDVDLQVALEPGLWNVLCDRGQMEQVILNLAVNGRDAMPRGGRLSVATHNVTVPPGPPDGDAALAAGEWVRLVVRDAGEGMSAEVKAHLFEPFFTTKRPGHGTGLGLATVYGIVEQSGGVILVESAPGLGTTFALSFPRAVSVAAASPAPAAPAPSPRTAARGSETVLVVEDDAQVREVTARALRAGGYRVLVAESAAEALQTAVLEPGRIDLLVTDVVMPDLDGRALAEALHGRHGVQRVLYVSGYTQDLISHRGVLDRGIEFLPKPFTAATLLGRVRALLDG